MLVFILRRGSAGFELCGCVILGVSIWIRTSKDVHEEINIDLKVLFPAVDLMIAIGSIIMVLGFLGCCGAIKESKCLLLLFFIGLFLILALQITAGVLGVVYRSQIEEELKLSVQKYLPLYSQDVTIRNAFEKFQKENECCGLTGGYKDWGSSIPQSCICPQGDDSSCVSVQGKLYYQQTCLTVIGEFMKEHLAIVTGIAFGVAIIQLIGLGFSMSMYCQIRTK
nr:PREDICTED: tetraspanin-8 isoform X2 [Latimeria chalumnae]|eukprot:XP_014339445.1 PREDICTED: tetraspanin-8 isoform X2 [Latimeria chalumnae]